MSYQITSEDLYRARMDRRIVDLVGHYSSDGYHREIKLDTIDDVFVILDHHEEVLRTGDGYLAVDTYNQIQPRS